MGNGERTDKDNWRNENRKRGKRKLKKNQTSQDIRRKRRKRKRKGKERRARSNFYFYTLSSSFLLSMIKIERAECLDKEMGRRKQEKEERTVLSENIDFPFLSPVLET